MSTGMTMYYPACLQGTFDDLDAFCSTVGADKHARAEIAAALGPWPSGTPGRFALNELPLGDPADRMHMFLERDAGGRVQMWVGVFSLLTPDEAAAARSAQYLERLTSMRCVVCATNEPPPATAGELH